MSSLAIVESVCWRNSKRKVDSEDLIKIKKKMAGCDNGAVGGRRTKR